MTNNSSSSYFNLMNSCGSSTTEVLASVTVLMMKFLSAVPLSVIVVCLGYRRWQRSIKTSHSDLFTYNSAALQLLFGFAVIFYLCGIYTRLTGVLLVGVYGAAIVFPGEIILHILTCVDRYLAVVHPITYWRLTQSDGIRIRCFSIVCVWLPCFGWAGVLALYYPNVPYIAYFFLLFISLISISFCSFSVLCVLIHPGPGQVGRKKETADKSKRKAFLTIMAILGALLMYFVATIVALVVQNLNVLNHQDECLILICAQCFNVPCGVVLPLLFLRKAKKL